MTTTLKRYAVTVLVLLAIALISLPVEASSIRLLSGDPIPIQDVSPTPTLTHTGMGANGTDWWSLVAIHFPEDQINTALAIIACESGGNPNARNSSGASGLFQIMPFWADHFGWEREWLFDASLNVEMARKVWDEQGWRGWSCYGRG